MKYQFEEDQRTSKAHSKEVPMSNMSAQQRGANEQQERTIRRCRAHIKNGQQGGANEQQEHTTRRCQQATQAQIKR